MNALTFSRPNILSVDTVGNPSVTIAHKFVHVTSATYFAAKAANLQLQGCRKR
jgi:hypothetical protein